MIVKNTPEEIVEYDDLNDRYIVYDYLNIDTQTNEPTQTYLTVDEWNTIHK